MRAETLQRQVWYAGCPLVLIGVLFGAYLISPGFFLRYVLEGPSREGQAVELVTFGAAVLAGVTLGWVAVRFWLSRRWRGTGSGFVLVAGVAMASLFFAGEEVSWGQSLAGEKLFESSLLDETRETNIHNATDIPVQSLGSAFLIVFFVVIPIAWRLRSRTRLPDDWAPAIAGWGVSVAMVVAFVWGKLNNVYVDVVENAKSTVFYAEFVHHVNEQKEMLIAVALLLYAFDRVAWLRSGARVVSRVSSDAEASDHGLGGAASV